MLNLFRNIKILLQLILQDESQYIKLLIFFLLLVVI